MTGSGRRAAGASRLRAAPCAEVPASADDISFDPTCVRTVPRAEGPDVLASIVLAVALNLVDLTPREPSLPVFGPGKVVNVFDGNAALTNASAHVAWSLAIPLAGKAVGGRKGMWIAGTSWIAWTIVNETFFHAPARPGPSYPAEVRADLLTRIVPCAMILAWDLLQHRP